MVPRAKTRDGVTILRDRYIGDDPERLAQLRDERVSADVAQLIYDARTSAGLSQKELAGLIGTTQSVISRLEDSDYGGRSLTMLERIARALGKKLTVAMTDAGKARKREAFVGFDSAWGDQVPGAISWVTFVDGRFEAFGSPELVHFEDAARIVEERRADADYVLVALDQPALVPNGAGMRPVERVAASLVSSLSGGVQPASRQKTSLFGSDAPVWRFLDRLDVSQNPPAARTATDGLHLIEVFPALALPALDAGILKRERAASYNPKNTKSFSLDDWRLVATAVQHHAERLSLAPLSEWAGRCATLDSPKKHDQDRLDAAICLVIALLWRRTSRDQMAVIGDRRGYMVTPISPEGRTILQRAAVKEKVPIDTEWSEDAHHRTTDSGPSEDIGHGTTDFGPKARLAGRMEYRCPIGGCTKVFRGSRGGWDAHVASPRIHPDWHPDVIDGRVRKERFKAEYPDW